MAAALVGRSRRHQRGSVAVEVGLLITLFFVLVIGIFDLTRIMFLWNTLSSVTRRAAASVATAAPAADHTAALTAVAFGGIPLSTPRIDGSYFRVEYLNSGGQSIAAPASALANVRACVRDPQDAGCVRSVKVRLCRPGGSGCERVAFEPLFPLGGITGQEILFPTFETVIPAGALGYRPGAGP